MPTSQTGNPQKVQLLPLWNGTQNHVSFSSRNVVHFILFVLLHFNAVLVIYELFPFPFLR